MFSLITNLLCKLIAHKFELILHHSDSALGDLSLLLEVIVSILQLIVHTLLCNGLLVQVSHLSLQSFLLLLSALTLVLLLFQLILNALCNCILLFALLVETVQVGLAVRHDLRAQLVLHLFKLASVALLDLIVDTRISLRAGAILTGDLDFQLNLGALVTNVVSLALTSLNLVLHLLDLEAKILKFSNILAVKLSHILLRLVSDLLSRSKRDLRVRVILGYVLRHVLEFIKVAKLTLLVVHNDLLVLLDTLHDLFSLALKSIHHASGVVTLGLSVQCSDEFLLLTLQVDGLGTL